MAKKGAWSMRRIALFIVLTLSVDASPAFSLWYKLYITADGVDFAGLLPPLPPRDGGNWKCGTGMKLTCPMAALPELG